MALGRTAKFYRSNPKSRQKHSDDNNSGKCGKYAHSKAYKKAHWHANNKLKIKPGSGMDASKQPDGSYKKESRKTNRGRGGAKRA